MWTNGKFPVIPGMFIKKLNQINFNWENKDFRIKWKNTLFTRFIFGVLDERMSWNKRRNYLHLELQKIFLGHPHSFELFIHLECTNDAITIELRQSLSLLHSSISKCPLDRSSLTTRLKLHYDEQCAVKWKRCKILKPFTGQNPQGFSHRWRNLRLFQCKSLYKSRKLHNFPHHAVLMALIWPPGHHLHHTRKKDLESSQFDQYTWFMSTGFSEMAPIKTVRVKMLYC